MSVPHQPQTQAPASLDRHDNALPVDSSRNADSLAVSQILNWRAAYRQGDLDVSTADQTVAHFATQSHSQFERDLINEPGSSFMREDWLPINLGPDDLISPFDINLDLQQLSHQPWATSDKARGPNSPQYQGIGLLPCPPHICTVQA